MIPVRFAEESDFIMLCRTLGLFADVSVAIDGSKFKAVNNRDKNFTRAKMERRMAQIEESVARYLEQLDTADRQEPSEALTTKTNRLKEKIETLKEQMRRLELLKVEMLATPDQQTSLTDPDARSMATSGRGSGVVGYNVQIAVEANHHLIVMHERRHGRVFAYAPGPGGSTWPRSGGPKERAPHQGVVGLSMRFQTRSGLADDSGRRRLSSSPSNRRIRASADPRGMKQV